MNLKAKVERDDKVLIKKVNNRTHFFERVYKTKEVRQQKSTKSIKHQKSSKSNEVKPTKKFKNAKELINLKEVKNTKEVKTHILVFLLILNQPRQGLREQNRLLFVSTIICYFYQLLFAICINCQGISNHAQLISCQRCK